MGKKSNKFIFIFYIIETKVSLLSYLSFLVMDIKVTNDINPFRVDKLMDIYYICCILLLILSFLFFVHKMYKKKGIATLYLAFLLYSIYSLFQPH